MAVLEPPGPLSSSKLWTWQREFYQREGVDAWGGKIPFLITSNPAIADSYAQIIVRLIQDHVRSGHAAAGEPFYVVELGAGHGAFSFHTLRRLTELRCALGLLDVPVVYVMTDFAARTIEHWRSHPGLAPFIAAGQLDVAAFDVAAGDELVLLESGRRIAASPAARARQPLVVIANYVFDTIPQDYLRLRDGVIEEGLVQVTTPDDNVVDGRPARLDQIAASFSYRPSRQPFYGEPGLDAVLAGYRDLPGEAHLLVPSGALRCLDRLAALTDGGLCLIMSDLGYARHSAASWQRPPTLNFHDDSFSLPVSLDLFRRWFEARGGEARVQLQERPLVTAVLLDRLRFDRLPETRLAVATLDTGGHAAIYSLIDHLLATRGALRVGSVLPALAASRWDPYLFRALLPRIIEHLRSWETSADSVVDLAIAAERVAERHYPLPNGPDAFFDVGRFFEEAQQHDKAAAYYLRSLELAPADDTTHYHLGLCRYRLGDHARAVEHFEAAVRSNPRAVLARGWIAQIAAETPPPAGHGS